MEQSKVTQHRCDEMPKERVTDLLERRLISDDRFWIGEEENERQRTWMKTRRFQHTGCYGQRVETHLVFIITAANG